MHDYNVECLPEGGHTPDCVRHVAVVYRDALQYYHGRGPHAAFHHVAKVRGQRNDAASTKACRKLTWSKGDVQEQQQRQPPVNQHTTTVRAQQQQGLRPLQQPQVPPAELWVDERHAVRLPWAMRKVWPKPWRTAP